MDSYKNAANTSGMGKDAVVPDEIKGWSWGAFGLNWIWAIGNNTWIGLLFFVPYLGFIMCIVLGMKGNEWAWQNKEWQSIEHFKRVQRKWTIAALSALILSIVLAILLIVLMIIFDVSFVTR